MMAPEPRARRSAMATLQPFVPPDPARLPRNLGRILLGLAIASAGASRAELPYPPASSFLEVQMSTYACSRDNAASSCDKARRLADPLLDNPRLSTSCKDALWGVRQRAVTAPLNSPERRDPIDKASRDVASYCRQPYVPEASQSNGPTERKPFSLKTFTP